MCVDAAYCYRQSSVVCLSRLSALQKRFRSRCPLGCGLQWAQETILDECPDPSMGMGNVEGKGRPIVKYMEY